VTTPTGDTPATPAPGAAIHPSAVPGTPPPWGHPAYPSFGQPPRPGHPAYGPPPGHPAYGPPPGHPAYGPPPGNPVVRPAWGPPPVPTAPDGRPLADFGDRLLARLIDGAILGAITTALMTPLVVFTVWYFLSRIGRNDAGLVVEDSDFGTVVAPWLLMYAGILLLSVVASYLYEVEYCFRKGGRTFGKRVMKLRIVPLDRAAVYHRGFALRRWLIMDVVSMFLPGFIYVDGLWQLGDRPYRQCLHDRYAATVVVKDVA
jgi:uncharacterized RDD family membrane protein YckC